MLYYFFILLCITFYFLQLKLVDTTLEEKICEIAPMKLYDKNDIEIKFFFKKESLDSEKTTINAIYSNKSDTHISSFVFEVRK